MTDKIPKQVVRYFHVNNREHNLQDIRALHCVSLLMKEKLRKFSRVIVKQY